MSKKIEEQTNKRIYKGTQEVDHDLFRLKPSAMFKNISYNKTKPILEPVEHGHIFHTVDSNGKKQDRCHKVGGHFHLVETISGVQGSHPTIKVSKAMHLVRERDELGAEKIVPQEIPHDKHTHDWEYIGSEKVKVRQINDEYVKFIATMDSRKPQKVDGVVG